MSFCNFYIEPFSLIILIITLSPSAAYVARLFYLDKRKREAHYLEWEIRYQERRAQKARED